MQSIESRYKAEIADLNQLLAENRRKSQETEDELRREIASLKAIIKDLEARLGMFTNEMLSIISGHFQPQIGEALYKNKTPIIIIEKQNQ